MTSRPYGAWTGSFCPGGTQKGENIMTRFKKPALALGLASALALAVATPSEARSGRNAAAIGAGIAGFAVGTALGAAAASHYAYGPYGYYDGYTYAPAYTTYGYAPVYGGYAYDSYAYSPGVTFYNRRDPSSFYAPYAPTYGVQFNSGWQNRERQLRGGDW
jgi:hypothetical protein